MKKNKNSAFIGNTRQDRVGWLRGRETQRSSTYSVLRLKNTSSRLHLHLNGSTEIDSPQADMYEFEETVELSDHSNTLLARKHPYIGLPTLISSSMYVRAGSWEIPEHGSLLPH